MVIRHYLADHVTKKNNYSSREAVLFNTKTIE